MSNVETVKAIYEAFGNGDIPFILSCLDENVAWEKWDDNSAQNADVPYMRERKNPQEVLEFFVETGKLGIGEFQVGAIMEGDGKIAVEFMLVAERFGKEEEMHLWTFNENGKVIGFRHYLDTAKHIAANEKYNSAGA